MRYNPDALHYKIVWPIGVPSIHHMWTDEDWLTYCRSFRPVDYHGDETDKKAWGEYIDNKNLEDFRKQWPNHDVALIGPDKFKFTKKEG